MIFKVVNPEKQIAKWTAIRYTSDYILDYIKLDDDYAIFEVKIPLEWIGKSIRQVDIRQKYKINVMAIKKNGHMNLAISADDIFTSDETLLVIGEHKAIQKCFHI